MWVLFYDKISQVYKVEKIPMGMSGERFLRNRGVIHLGDHDTREQAELEKRREQALTGPALAHGDKVKTLW
jgi:hypothetical protein